MHVMHFKVNQRSAHIALRTLDHQFSPQLAALIVVRTDGLPKKNPARIQ